MRGTQPTIHDVAALSGMSRGTVSRYLNGGKNVSPAAAKAIETAIASTGYRVNSLARSLRNARTDCIAFLLPQPIDLLFSDPVHGLLARECSAALSRRNLSMVMVMAGDETERGRARSYLLSGHVDGVLVVAGEAERSLLDALQATSLPVVACSPAREGLASVASDSAGAFTGIVELLRSEGRRRVAFLGGTSALDETPLRLDGYRRGMGPDADPDLVAVPRGGTAPAAVSVAALLDRTDFDALVCVNDVAAAEALDVLRRAGRRVPEDVAVVGFDNIEAVCTAAAVPLTSIAQDFSTIAEHMVTRLHGPAGHTAVPTRIVRRASA